MTRANIPVSAKQAAKMYNNNKFVFDNLIQRSYVWEARRKSDLIHSMIEGYPIPPFYARRIDGKTYDFLDGKQRMSAIAGFINDEYELVGMPPIVYVDDNGIEMEDVLDGMKFSELPECIQDTIKDYSLTIYYYDDITDEQVREMFRKLNNGKPLSSKEKNIAACIDIKNITDLGKHPLFNIMFNEKGREQRKMIPVTMKVWSMLNNDIEDVSFESKVFNELMANTTTTELEREELSNVFDYYLETWRNISERDNKAYKNVLKKMLVETNFVSVSPFVKDAMESNIDTNMFADFMIELFADITVSDEYVTAASAGAAKNINIKKRNNEIEKKWKSFFDTDENNTDDNVDNTEDTVEYKYGMRVRGFSPMCQPDGVVRREDDTTGKYLDVIVYNRELTDKEVEDYSLDRL